MYALKNGVSTLQHYLVLWADDCICWTFFTKNESSGCRLFLVSCLCSVQVYCGDNIWYWMSTLIFQPNWPSEQIAVQGTGTVVDWIPKVKSEKYRECWQFWKQWRWNICYLQSDVSSQIALHCWSVWVNSLNTENSISWQIFSTAFSGKKELRDWMSRSRVILKKPSLLF